MTWMSLEKLITDMMPHIPKLGTPPENLRSAAGELAIRTFGTDFSFAKPALVNVAALALLMKDRLIVHRVSDGAARVVHDTDLHTLPGEPPTLLRRAFVITSRSPEKGLRLFGDTVELAGYAVDDKLFLIGLNYPDGIMVAQWRPHWEEQDIEIGTPEDKVNRLIEDFEKWTEWGQQAARFAVMLGLLLDAEGTPIVIKDDGPRTRGKRPTMNVPRSKNAPHWTTRKVFVDGRLYWPLSPPSHGESETHDRSHLQETTVMVSGHLRRQPYGPKNSLRKWVYVRSYEARRWVLPERSVRVDVRSIDE